jgi:hypothetical protein
MKKNKEELSKVLPLTIQNASVNKKVNKQNMPFISIKKYQSTQNGNDTFYRPISKL